jgi:ubiquinone biosynthesis protein
MMGGVTQAKKPSILLRYERVISVLLKYGFEDMLSHPPLNKLVPKSDKWVPNIKGKAFFKYSRNQRIRMVCEELGPTFIKFAQIASNRPDILPEDLVAELSKLQENAPSVKEKEIMDVLRKELPRPIDELLEYINKKPLASASIAQVHRARLIGGREVVLKIQRPGIRSIIEADITILKKLAGIMVKYFPQYNSYQPLELVEMFETSIRKELQFSLEASNLKRFQYLFKGNPDIYIPDIYPELSTDRVLCLEYVEGCKITDLDAIKAYGFTGPEIAFRGISLYFEMVFDHGFFHADPHPGNIFVLPNGKICFLDFGMMGTILEKDKLQFADLLLAVHEEDMEGLKKALLKFCTQPQSIDHTELEYDIMTFFENYRDMTIDAIEGEEVMRALNSLFFDYNIKIPSQLLLLLKALLIIEGVGLKIDPKYNIIENINPFVSRLIDKKMGLTTMKKNISRSLEELLAMSFSMPGDVKAVIQKIKQGKLHLEFEHKGLEPFYHKMEVTTNRLAFSFILAALILGSALLVHSGMPPLYKGVPLFGLIGFVISGFLAVKLLVSIIKHGSF